MAEAISILNVAVDANIRYYIVNTQNDNISAKKLLVKSIK